MSSEYELLFEGPEDDSARTLQRIKGVFVADLEFPIGDVQRFLESAPITIKTAGSEADLKKEMDLLSKAGARVMIVKPIAQDDVALGNEQEISIEPLSLEYDTVLQQEPTETVSSSLEPVNSLELSFDFENTEKPFLEAGDPKVSAPAQAAPSKDAGDESSPNLTLELSLDEPKSINQSPEKSLESKSTTDLKAEPASPSSPDEGFSLELSPDEVSSPILEPAASKENVSVASDSSLATKSSLTADSSLTLDSPPTTAPEVATEEPVPAEQSPSSGLELEVVTPSGSTLFGTTGATEESNESALQHVETDSTKQTQSSSEVSAPVHQDSLEPATSVTSETVSSEQEAPVIELTEEQLKRLQSKPRSYKFLAIPAIVVILVGVLFVLNQSLHSGKPQENPFFALIDQLPKLIPEMDPEEQKRKLAQKAAELAESSWFSAEKNFANRSIKATIWVEKSIPIHGTVEVSTPEPVPLTKEQIVNNVAPTPWLKRLDIKDLSFKKINEQIVAEGPALAYVTRGEINLRLSGTAKLTLSPGADENSFVLEMMALAPTAKTQASTPQPSNETILRLIPDPASPSRLHGFEFSEKLTLKRQ